MKIPAYANAWQFLVFSIVLLILPLPSARANDIVVDKHCSLAQAIGSANNNSSKARCETGYREDTIILEDDLDLLDELPAITSKIVLEGNNHTIFVKPRYPAFTIKYGDLTINNLRVKFSGKNRAGPTIEIVNGSLSIIDSQIERCTGKFLVEDSFGTVLGDSDVCGYSAETVESWFSGPAPIATAIPAPAQSDTCAALTGTTATISARYGLGSGLQCQQVDATGIGNAGVVQSGFIDAVDVWGYVEQGVEICFAQQGAIVFLDAATAPRMPAPVEQFARDGKTCAAFDRPGTVVLVPGQAPARETEAPVDPPTPQCSITTTVNLKLRAAPAIRKNIIGYVSRGTSFVPIARTTYWFNVDYHGTLGWINANPSYVIIAGACA